MAVNTQIFNYADDLNSLEQNLTKWSYVISKSVDTDLISNRDSLVARSRDIFMKNSLAQAIIRAITSGVIGTGLYLNVNIDYEYLGISKEKAIKWNNEVEYLWKSWINSTACDYFGKSSFYQWQKQAYMSSLLNGDVFIGLVSEKRKSDDFLLRLMLIDSDRVVSPPGYEYSKNVLAGVERDCFDKICAYYIAKYHPQDLRALDQTWTRVPAVDPISGRPYILHFFQDIERVGQIRGIPVLAGALKTFYKLDKYVDIELAAALVTSMITTLIKHKNDNNGFSAQYLANAINGVNTEQPENQDVDFKMRDGVFAMEVPKHLDVETQLNTRQNQNFGNFIETLMTLVGSSLQIPVEVILNKFNSSFSASKCSFLMANKAFSIRQDEFKYNVLMPIFREWLCEQVASNKIKAPGFFSDKNIQAAYLRHDWFGDALPHLDPEKEAKAAKLRVDNGFSTREKEAILLSGLDSKVILEARATEKRNMEKLGIKAFSPKDEVEQPSNSSNKNQSQRQTIKPAPAQPQTTPVEPSTLFG